APVAPLVRRQAPAGLAPREQRPGRHGRLRDGLTMPEILDLVDRAASDPDFLQRLRRDPYGTARGAGVDVSHGALSEFLGTGGASEAEVAEALQSRLSYSLKQP